MAGEGGVRNEMQLDRHEADDCRCLRCNENPGCNERVVRAAAHEEENDIRPRLRLTAVLDRACMQ